MMLMMINDHDIDDSDEHLIVFPTIGLFLKSVFLQDPDQTAGANKGGPRFAQEPPQHDERAPLGQQAGHGYATLGAQAWHAAVSSSGITCQSCRPA